MIKITKWNIETFKSMDDSVKSIIAYSLLYIINEMFTQYIRYTYVMDDKGHHDSWCN